MASKNIIEKIWDEHIVHREHETHPYVFAIDLLFMHEVTSAQAFDTLREKNVPIYSPDRCMATVDHSTPTRVDRFNIHDVAARHQVETMRRNAIDNDISFFDLDSWNQWIVHVIGPELWMTQPWMTIACWDSHTATHGAFWALAFGIWTSEVWHVLASSCLLQNKPKTMKVEFAWTLQKWVFSKDMILKLIAEIGIGGWTGFIIEFTWEAIRNLTMEERLTLCNMTIECWARSWLIAPDETTFEYLKWRPCWPKEEEYKDAVEKWKTYVSDPDCSYDEEISIDMSNVGPMVTWGTNPEQGVEITGSVPVISELPETHKVVAQNALDYIWLNEWQDMEWIPVEWAFVGSCTNWRIEDLRITADLLKWKKVHKDVTFYVVPWSERVHKQAIKEWIDKIVEEAWAQFRMPWCSMCLAMNDDKVPSWKRVISSSNRNFMWRQWPWSLTHLASPATVTVSAIEWKITSPLQYL